MFWQLKYEVAVLCNIHRSKEKNYASVRLVDLCQVHQLEQEQKDGL